MVVSIPSPAATLAARPRPFDRLDRLAPGPISADACFRVAEGPTLHRPRHPEQTALWRLFDQHYLDFTRVHEERFEREDRPLRGVVTKTVIERAELFAEKLREEILAPVPHRQPRPPDPSPRTGESGEGLSAAGGSDRRVGASEREQ
jgi:hypothetical protein